MLSMEIRETESNIRISNLLANARTVLKKDGVVSLFSQLISIIFMYEKIVIFRKDLECINSINPLKDNYTLKIILSKKELHDLIDIGFRIGSSFNIFELERKVDQGEVLFAVFANGLLVHKAFVLLRDTGTLDAPIAINWNREAYVQFVETSSEYRGRHIYPYVSYNIFNFARGKGKTVCVASSTVDNISSIKAHLRSGYKLTGIGRYLRLFVVFIFWKEKSLR